MCDCQAQGCAFDSKSGQCSKITGEDVPTTFTAGVLGGCNQASTAKACTSSIAWTNRFGGKTDCAWCSGVCVRTSIADETCDKGTRLSSLVKAGTINTHVTKPTPPVTRSRTEIQKAIIDRVTKNNGAHPKRVSLGVSLVWWNCNDLDLWMTTPSQEMVKFNSRGPTPRDHAKLDVDYKPTMKKVGDNLECVDKEPVENINIQLPSGKKLTAGIYTITVHYYSKKMDEVSTPYSLGIFMNGRYN